MSAGRSRSLARGSRAWFFAVAAGLAGGAPLRASAQDAAAPGETPTFSVADASGWEVDTALALVPGVRGASPERAAAPWAHNRGVPVRTTTFVSGDGVADDLGPWYVPLAIVQSAWCCEGGECLTPSRRELPTQTPVVEVCAVEMGSTVEVHERLWSQAYRDHPMLERVRSFADGQVVGSASESVFGPMGDESGEGALTVCTAVAGVSPGPESPGLPVGCQRFDGAVDEPVCAVQSAQRRETVWSCQGEDGVVEMTIERRRRQTRTTVSTSGAEASFAYHWRRGRIVAIESHLESGRMLMTFEYR